ncbi:hypothetical protein CDAR_39931 [Caerostris darwini]|uniref:Uncharacterized protein n=1 Tax=Caerostris darwini TaxID=1538125 RepID=A0AAV4MM82_9ARAC|nr:hypothetical protein CDAR_39931 [Caerostris darwini]
MGLQPPDEGPFQALSRSEKVFKLLIHGRQSVVNIDRLKPGSDINPHIKSVTLECAIKDKCSDPTAKRKQSGCIQKCCVIRRYAEEYRRWETAKHSPNSWNAAVEL